MTMSALALLAKEADDEQEGGNWASRVGGIVEPPRRHLKPTAIPRRFFCLSKFPNVKNGDLATDTLRMYRWMAQA